VHAWIHGRYLEGGRQREPSESRCPVQQLACFKAPYSFSAASPMQAERVFILITHSYTCSQLCESVRVKCCSGYDFNLPSSSRKRQVIVPLVACSPPPLSQLQRRLLSYFFSRPSGQIPQQRHTRSYIRHFPRSSPNDSQHGQCSGRPLCILFPRATGEYRKPPQAWVLLPIV